ncbi:MAG: hypothetical protein GEU91_03690 [Rhizobiales bacterium]|nr:hypothetical protein [Hyphomicrobiales bacterium]
MVREPLRCHPGRVSEASESRDPCIPVLRIGCGAASIKPRALGYMGPGSALRAVRDDSGEIGSKEARHDDPGKGRSVAQPHQRRGTL